MPRGEHVAGAADRCAHAHHVRIDAQAVPGEAVVGVAHAARDAAGLLAAAHQREILAGEHAVFGTAVGQRQLDHFEVIRAADDELLRLRLVRLAVLHVVRQGQLQGAVVVLHASGPGAVVVLGLEAGGAFDVVGRERIAHAALEAVPVRGLVHDHVVVADGVGRAERHAHVGVQVVERERIDVAEVLGRDVGLAAQFEQAPFDVAQADGGLAAEHAATLRTVAVIGREAAFQREDRRQAVAQVFRTAQTPARTVLDAVVHAHTGSVVAAIQAPIGVGRADFAALVGQAQVDDAIQRHRGFGIRRAGHTGQNGASEQGFC
ncbi:hypothetical protein FQZ97_715010 [compost metagenome]